MTTREQQPGTDRTLDSVSEGDLQVRLWVGQNPLPFVAVCVTIGYWIGRGARRGARS